MSKVNTTLWKIGVAVTIPVFAFLMMPGERHLPLAYAGPDINPAAPPVGFWAGIPVGAKAVNHAIDAAGKYKQIGIKIATADAGLIATHNRSAGGVGGSVARNLCHIHWEVELTAAEKVEVNAFWDWFYDVAAPSGVTMVSGATNQTNCHTYAHASRGKGTYTYWFNQAPVPGVVEAYSDDTTPVAKAGVAAGDLLFYKTQDHSTVVDKVNAGGSGVAPTYDLIWKFHSGGVYKYTATTLDTPGSNPVGVLVVGAPPPAGKYSTSGAGKEANLDPAGKVRR
jgi:hypothetical protein